MKLNNNDDSHNSGLNLLIYNMLLDIESHPTWVCGLKRCGCVAGFKNRWSHPTWVCGLKHSFEPLSYTGYGNVTPYVGVWIETTITSSFAASTIVTPYVGVWIETMEASSYTKAIMCHTLRGCVD